MWHWDRASNKLPLPLLHLIPPVTVVNKNPHSRVAPAAAPSQETTSCACRETWKTQKEGILGKSGIHVNRMQVAAHAAPAAAAAVAIPAISVAVLLHGLGLVDFDHMNIHVSQAKAAEQGKRGQINQHTKRSREIQWSHTGVGPVQQTTAHMQYLIALNPVPEQLHRSK